MKALYFYIKVTFIFIDMNKIKMEMQSQTLSVLINRSADDVYEFISDPRHLPQWAPGFCLSIQKSHGTNSWLIETPAGQATVRFVEKNDFRIIDHYVSLVPGVEVYVPLRVLKNNSVSEVIFTVFRLTNMTDEQFANDIDAVQKDLSTLKQVLEK